MNKVNSIIFNLADFKSEDKLFEAVNNQINLLLKSGNICVVVKSSSKDMICIILLGISLKESLSPTF